MEIKIKVIVRKRKWRNARGIYDRYKEVKILIKDEDKKILYRYVINMNNNRIVMVGYLPEREYYEDDLDEWVILKKIEKEIDMRDILDAYVMSNHAMEGEENENI